MTDEQKADLHRMLDESMNLADGIKNPVEVATIRRVQAGQEILVSKCPKCGSVAALAGEGKHLCRGCGTWLKFLPPDARSADEIADAIRNKG